MTRTPVAVVPPAAALTGHLQQRVPQYFAVADTDATELRLTDTQIRPRTSLLRYDLRLAGAQRTLLVKLASAPRLSDSAAAVPVSGDRPRIAPFVDDRLAVDLEYRALQRIHEHFGRQNDPRFGAVTVFERLVEYDGFVMEAVNQPDLRRMAFRRRAPELAAAFAHAGAWLASYHRLPPDGSEASVQNTRHAFIEFAGALAGYLTTRVGHADFFTGLTGRIASVAQAHMPEHLPVALAHGDYAMRNILVGEGHRVTVLDTFARFQTSPYRDVGYFLGDLRCSVLAGIGRGAVGHVARWPAYRQAFLTGYFGDQHVPRAVVALYEVQALLERWASVVHDQSESLNRRRALRRASLSLLTPCFRWWIGSALRATTEEPPPFAASGSPPPCGIRREAVQR